MMMRIKIRRMMKRKIKSYKYSKKENTFTLIDVSVPFDKNVDVKEFDK